MQKVSITIDITGHFYIQWPKIKITLNGEKIFDDQIINNQILNFTVDCHDSNTLKIIHYDKSFGDNNIWHSNGKEECWAEINDIKFDDVSIEHLKSKLIFTTDWTTNQYITESTDFINTYSVFNSNGRMSFNGCICLNFETPVYNWLIPAKFKTLQVKTAYFSSSTQRWHYDADKKIIEEIKTIMKFT